MDHLVAIAREPFTGPRCVPVSKSLEQRALVLAALCGGAVRLARPPGARPPGEDVRRTSLAVDALGRWDAQGGSLGSSRDRLVLDLGEGATGFRFCTALAALRPTGARTLLRGRPRLLRRPHAPLLRALRGLGARIKRRSSGSLRVLGGGLAGGRVTLDSRLSSQYASALLLTAPCMRAALELELAGRPASLPYLRLTLDVLAAFGARIEVEGLEGEKPRIRVEPSPLGADVVRLEPDASAAAAWWTAAALWRSEAWIPGLRATSRQADVSLLAILERMGAVVDDAPDGSVRVRGPEALHAAGVVDLQDAPDLLFLVGILAARAEGDTRIRGVAHTRGKESDRVEVLIRGLRTLGADVRLEAEDVVHVQGGPLHGGHVDTAGDHRAAFAFGVLGLGVPGLELGRAEGVIKSQPRFLEDLAALGGESADGGARP